MLITSILPTSTLYTEANDGSSGAAQRRTLFFGQDLANSISFAGCGPQLDDVLMFMVQPTARWDAYEASVPGGIRVQHGVGSPATYSVTCHPPTVGNPFGDEPHEGTVTLTAVCGEEESASLFMFRSEAEALYAALGKALSKY